MSVEVDGDCVIRPHVQGQLAPALTYSKRFARDLKDRLAVEIGGDKIRVALSGMHRADPNRRRCIVNIA